MEPVREPPWAEHEKVYLLAEILKATAPAHVLLKIIRESNLQPPWTDIALPHGRSLRSSQMAFNDMNAAYSMPDYRPRAQLPAPIIYPGPELSKKRQHQPEALAPGGRLLQPRPPHPYPGDFGPVNTFPPITSHGEPANKKKRGRPTKAESQARAEAAAARGEVYPPPRRGRPSLTGTEQSPGEPPRPGATPLGSAPGPPMRAVTPQQTQPEPSSESSSGKKKRNKPTPLELEKPRRNPMGTESPLDFGSAPGDPSRSQPPYTFTPISAPLPSSTEPRDRDRDVRMEGVEESQPRTTTPHSFKDTVGI